ncbi:DUF2612 domain-containing protein [Acetobacteraceae bacterium EV16G]|uniref:DUF2612 domain-containing protein n=1 Tax=Sorlinia euscelidii TaxID=3081148 RepID=A0ABU7U230_9PROT
MRDLSETILAQYAASPRLRMILDGFNQSIDPRNIIDQWYQRVFDLKTASGWGLDVWGRIVGIARVIPVAKTEYLGFEEADDRSGTARPMNDGVFYRGTAVTSGFALTDDAYRQLILAKAAANLCSGSIADINAILMTLFGAYGDIWVEETSATTMTICYSWDLTPAQSTIIVTSKALPRPSGLRLTYRYVAP